MAVNIIEKKIVYVSKSQVTISATVDAESVSQEYNFLIEKYRKTLSISGFRKGNVPIKIVQSRYAQEIKSQLISDLINNTIDQLSPEFTRKPLPYARPSFEGSLDLILGEKFSFSLHLDVEPECIIADCKEFETILYKVQVNQQDIEQELEKLRENNAIVISKNDKDVAEVGDVVTVNYFEIDEHSQEIENSHREGLVFILGDNVDNKDFPPDFIEAFLGMKIGEKKFFQNDLSKFSLDTPISSRTATLQVQLMNLKRRELPILDDNFAQTINKEYKNLNDLREMIKKTLVQNAEESVPRYRIASLVSQLVKSTDIELPESMIEVECRKVLQDMVQKNGLDAKTFLTGLKSAKEAVYKELREEVITKLKHYIILNKLREQFDLSISDGELLKIKEDLLLRYNMSENDIVKQIGQEEWQRYAEEKSRDEKFQQLMLDTLTVYKEKEVSWREFLLEVSAT